MMLSFMSPKARLIGAVCAAFVLLVGSAVWMLTRSSSVPETSSLQTEYAEGEVRTVSVTEETERYRIDADYPQFGISSIDQQISYGVGILVSEFKDNANETSPLRPYELFSTFDGVYMDDSIVSARLAISEYTGGAHPGTTIYGLNYDRTTGRELVLDDALALIGATLEQVAEAASAQLAEGLGDSFFSDGATPDPDNYQTFSISKDAVTFIFDEYQVAPYAAGPQGVAFAREN